MDFLFYFIGILVTSFLGFAVIDRCMGSGKSYDATGHRGNVFWTKRNIKHRRNKDAANDS